ncbi:hypothetical protein PR202_ga09745 [Eleusine coracana subsp. coracana]|uniref:Ubiquitin-like protease family profile domain-containing protein n=1 Tax=Eleusine coracana subsp. coracana TaxID=191504 RepID=A0AAV5C5B3_ELECO|nr:hypothetical protein PR202_ga09745 [Eleusine coracana subsp. coracana]
MELELASEANPAMRADGNAVNPLVEPFWFVVRSGRQVVASLVTWWWLPCLPMGLFALSHVLLTRTRQNIYFSAAISSTGSAIVPGDDLGTLEKCSSTILPHARRCEAIALPPPRAAGADLPRVPPTPPLHPHHPVSSPQRARSTPLVSSSPRARWPPLASSSLHARSSPPVSSRLGARAATPLHLPPSSIERRRSGSGATLLLQIRAVGVCAGTRGEEEERILGALEFPAARWRSSPAPSACAPIAAVLGLGLLRGSSSALELPAFELQLLLLPLAREPHAASVAFVRYLARFGMREAECYEISCSRVLAFESRKRIPNFLVPPFHRVSSGLFPPGPTAPHRAPLHTPGCKTFPLLFDHRSGKPLPSSRSAAAAAAAMAVPKGRILIDWEEAMSSDPALEVEFVGSSSPVTRDRPTAARAVIDDGSDGDDGIRADFANLSDEKLREKISSWRFDKRQGVLAATPDGGEKMRIHVRRMEKELERRQIIQQKKEDTVRGQQAKLAGGSSEDPLSPYNFNTIDEISDSMPKYVRSPCPTSNIKTRVKDVVHVDLDDDTEPARLAEIEMSDKCFLEAEWRHLQKDSSYDIPFSRKIWECLPRNIDKKKVPRQQNEYDCGLFMLYYNDRFIQDAPERLTREELRMFGCKWFEPKDASGLREGILSLVFDVFQNAQEDDGSSVSESQLGHHSEGDDKDVNTDTIMLDDVAKLTEVSCGRNIIPVIAA